MRIVLVAPSAYAAEKVNLSYQPAFSFGSRQEDKKRSDVPGKCQMHRFFALLATF